MSQISRDPVNSRATNAPASSNTVAITYWEASYGSVYLEWTDVNSADHAKVHRSLKNLTQAKDLPIIVSMHSPYVNDYTDNDSALRANTTYLYTIHDLRNGADIQDSYPATAITTTPSSSQNSSAVTLLFHNISGNAQQVEALALNEISGREQDTQARQGSFAWVVPQKTSLGFYLHPKGSVSQGIWELAHHLDLPNSDLVQDTSVSIAQNSLGNLEALARVTDGSTNSLVAFELNQNSGWNGPFIATANNGPIDQITGSQALIQDEQGPFELLVPRKNVIYHYRHDPQTLREGSWRLVATLPPVSNNEQIAINGVSLIATTAGKLEAIAWITPSPNAESDILVAYEFDQGAWQGPFPIIAGERLIDRSASFQGTIDQVTGTPDIIQLGQGPLELLVPQGNVINHYRHDGATIKEGNWILFATLPSPGDQITNVSLTRNPSGKLEAIARVSPTQGNDYFVGYEFDETTGWTVPTILSSSNGPIVPSDNQSPPLPPSNTLPTIAIIALILVLLGLGIWWFVSHNNGK